MVVTTQLRLALETEKERRAKKRNGFDLDMMNLIWIEIGVLKNKIISRNELARSVTIFLVVRHT